MGKAFSSALAPVGFQVMSLSNSTAIAINSTCRASTALLFSVETNDVRMRTDATAPTLSTGVLYPTGGPYWILGYNGTSLMKFQRSTGTAKVSIMAYKNVTGDR